jgi:hypothetical protein
LDYALVLGFLGTALAILPYESLRMHAVLSQRARTMKAFEAQHLDLLHDKQGVAFDIGYIGYFSQARMCDLAGLVNGRQAARMSLTAREFACTANQPGFMFFNVGQMQRLNKILPIGDWQVCGQYDFVNFQTPDMHYLLLPPNTAAEVCRAISGSLTTPASLLLHSSS